MLKSEIVFCIKFPINFEISRISNSPLIYLISPLPIKYQLNATNNCLKVYNVKCFIVHYKSKNNIYKYFYYVIKITSVYYTDYKVHELNCSNHIAITNHKHTFE